MGLSAQTLAAALDITISWYDDLEMHDDELYQTLSLHQSGVLADQLGTTPFDLARPEGVTAPAPVTMSDVFAAITRELERTGETLDAFGDRIGWDLSKLRTSPDAAWKEWN